MSRRGWAVAARRALLIIVWGALAAGCEAGTKTTPTATFEQPTPLPSVVPSATVDPVLPTPGEPGGEVVGASNPTQAGLAAEGEPSLEAPTVTPLPTQAQLPMPIGVADGTVIQATYYSAPLRPAPGVLLLPMRERDQSSWAELIPALQARGYAVLALDLRGYGASGGEPNWTLAQGDVSTALAQLADLPGIDPGRLAVIGAAVGANLGLNACADFSGCAATVLLSPGLDIRGITTASAIARLAPRPVLIVASENDENNPADSLTLDGMAAGDHQVVILPAAGHGTDMFAAEPGLAALIVDWLAARVVPPALVPTSTPGL